MSNYEQTTNTITIPQAIPGIPASDMATIHALYNTWKDHYTSNLQRTTYYNGEETVKNLNISIPEDVARRVRAVVGWSAKTVRALADLSVLEGISTLDGDPHGLQSIMCENNLRTVIPQAITSAYKHSCSFLTVYKDVDAGGRVRITPRSALMSSALWNMQQQTMRAALTITATDERNQIKAFRVWLPGYSYEITRNAHTWTATRNVQAYQGVSVVPICYDPQLDRPFGRSRITKPLMSYTDMAIRTFVRMEATAEFYSIPKLWFLGLSEDAQRAEWSSYISAVNGVTKDEDGDTPTLQQVTQASMTPHTEMLQTIALMVASETGLPVGDLGITMANPTSAEAMSVAERKLTREADRQNQLFTRAILQALGIAASLQEDLPTIPSDVWNTRIIWKPTQEVSLGARGDFFQKIAATCPSYALSAIAWQRLGFSDSEARVLLSEAQKSRALDTLQTLLGEKETAGDGDTAGRDTTSNGESEDQSSSTD